MALCSSCARVNVANLTRQLHDLPPWWELVGRNSTPRGMIHLDDARDLPASASAGCPLCGLMVQALLQDINNSSSFQASNHSPNSYSKRSVQHLQDELAPQPIYLRPNYDILKPSFPEDGADGAWHVRGLKVVVPVDQGVLTGLVRLYARRDSPMGVSCDVIGRPPLPSPDSPEAFDLIERWMQTCLSKHDACKETLSGTVIDESMPPILPTRVVHVGRPDGVVSPRLFETQGERGHYVALSHCWGPLSHRPVMTTHSSLADHLASIPWDALPPTYQDAISVTHRLGFAYIWIDSLCIIQDSHSDWLGESKRMGNVYQHARLTIAASHAADSAQPCFVTRPPPAPAVELPNVTAAGNIEGSIFASLLPDDYAAISPDSGALAYRAWATQEWLLSRRMVFYTTGSLVWSCLAISQRETGASFHATTRNVRWKNIVEKYSARLLTQQTDRLIALDGIRSALATKRPEDTYCLGLWKNSMPDQLLWYCIQPAERSKSELGLPTWTWASTLHGVRFLDIKGAKNACKGFRFDEPTTTLSIRGVVRKIAIIAPLAEADVASPLDPLLFAHAPRSTVTPNLLFALYMDHARPLGWCVLDENVPIHADIYCLPLMQKATVRSLVAGPPTTVCEYWILCLQRMSDSTHPFQRVGVGRITASKNWFNDLGLVNVDVR